MRSVSLQSVITDVATRLGLNPNRDITSQWRANAVTYINRRLTKGWRFDYWPEWTVVEQRYYRDIYRDGDFYQAGDERFYVASGIYYQALQGQNEASQPPATLTGSTWTENSAWWAECAASYCANDWTTGTVFAVGDKTRNPADAQYYQCISAHTAGPTFDPTQFGRLKAFQKFIAYEQDQQTQMDSVKRVCRRDPRVYPKNPGKIPFVPNNLGIVLDACAPNQVWLEFRLRPPVFTSTAYSSSTAYDQNDLVYADGDTFVSLIGNNQGNAPDGVAAWALVQFPAILADFVAQCVYADLLQGEKQTDRKRDALEDAETELTDALDRELDAQGQYAAADVETYGTQPACWR